jgi:putative hemolysin
MNRMLLIALTFSTLVVAVCGPQPAPTPTVSESPMGLPNPASEVCVDQGYQLEIRTDAGGQAGYCIFPGWLRVRGVGFLPG